MDLRFKTFYLFVLCDSCIPAHRCSKSKVGEMSGVFLKRLVLALLVSAHGLLADPTGPPRTEEGDESADSASTLAFVFDVTGSMYDDLKQVIEGASRILEKTLSRRTRPIQNFVLVPFHDPGTERAPGASEFM